MKFIIIDLARGIVNIHEYSATHIQTNRWQRFSNQPIKMKQLHSLSRGKAMRIFL